MLRQEIQWAWDWRAVAAGFGVFVVWIGLEGRYPQIGHSSFDPYAVAGPWNVSGIISIRLFGAAIVVPLMEELFWRSFVMRFLVASRFKSVPLGQFSWYAFVITAVAFGFEHHRWLPGIIAGIVYGALLCRSRNLFSPILAHTVTNLLLGIYVLQTEQWSFW
jgi:CAAX prenyl protease-like protein